MRRHVQLEDALDRVQADHGNLVVFVLKAPQENRPNEMRVHNGDFSDLNRRTEQCRASVIGREACASWRPPTCRKTTHLSGLNLADMA